MLWKWFRNVFLTPTSKRASMEMAADMIKTAGSERRRAVIVCVPRQDRECSTILEETGVWGAADICELPLFLLPFDKDAFSLGYRDFFWDYYRDCDTSGLALIAEGLSRFERLFGEFPAIHCIGSASRTIAELVIGDRSRTGRHLKQDKRYF